MRSVFPDQLEMLCQKGFYPYEWFDNVKKFEFQGLPKAKEFYSCFFTETHHT